MIAGTNSGCGKTTVTCAVLQALVNRKINVSSFKCGPDYIDPMFHKTVIGTAAYNLDTYLMSNDAVNYLLNKNSGDIAVIEGVMGFYDGFFGPGTGTFLIFGFLFLGCDFVTAAGNGKALNTASNLAGLATFIFNGSVVWVYGIIMGLSMIAGAYFGTKMAIKHGAAYVRPLFLTVTTLLIGKQIYDIFFK